MTYVVLKLAERWGCPPWEVERRGRWVALALDVYGIEGRCRDGQRR